MKKINPLLEEYLTKIGAMHPIKLGEPNEESDVEIGDANSWIKYQLEKDSSFNLRLVYIIVSFLIFIFLICTLFVFYFSDQSAIVGLLIFIAFFSMLVSVKVLQSIWVEKNKMDFLKILLHSLPDRSSSSIIEALYYSEGIKIEAYEKNNELKTQAREMISKNQTKQVIEVLMDSLYGKAKDELIIISARFEEMESKIISNTQRNDSLTIERNSINQSILKLLEKL